MTGEQGSERMTDEQVGAMALDMWPTVKAWTDSSSQPWVPASGSRLAEDDQLAQGFAVSYLARVSLVIGSEHLMTMLVYSWNYYPSLFSMQTLLRTAMVGGAQAVWLLSPDERAKRVEHALRLSQDTYWNQLRWAETITTKGPNIVDHDELATVKESLSNVTPAGKRSAEVPQVPLVKAAAEYVYSQPPDPDIVSECLAEFRYLSGVAHALPWNLHTRADKVKFENAGQRGELHVPSWTHLQGAMSQSYAFLHTGWRLLHEHGATPKPPA